MRPNLLASAAFALASISASAEPTKPMYLVVVDKGVHKIHMCEQKDGKIQILKSFHVTTGKVPGDKEVEKDLKTPEGIYFFRSKSMPPGLKKKFGAMAFYIDYPNVIDKKAGKTGYDIMLHSTDDPPRLQRDLDSEGCAVVNDEQIAEIGQRIKLGLTPIIIYAAMKPEDLSETSNPAATAAFEGWLKAWEGKDIDNYINSYATNFSYNGMDLKKYREYKRSLNKKYDEIAVGAKNIHYLHHPKYEVVIFQQNYESKIKGRTAFKSIGTKSIYMVKEGDKYKIAAEEFTQLRD